MRKHFFRYIDFTKLAATVPLCNVKPQSPVLRGTDYIAKTAYHVFISNLSAMSSFTLAKQIFIKASLKSFKKTIKMSKTNY